MRFYVNRIKQAQQICSNVLTKTVIIPLYNGNITKTLFSAIFLSKKCGRNVIIALLDNTNICKIEKDKLYNTLLHLYKIHQINLNIRIETITTIDAVVTGSNEIIINLFLYRIFAQYKEQTVIGNLYLDDLLELELRSIYKFKHFDLYPFCLVPLHEMQKYLKISIQVPTPSQSLTRTYRYLTYPILSLFNKKLYEDLKHKLQIIAPSSLLFFV